MVYVLSFIFCLGSFLLTNYRIRTRGLIRGGRPVWVAALLLVPCWMTLNLFGVQLDARSLCALAFVLGVFGGSYGPVFSLGWRLADFAMLFIVAAITMSQFIWHSVSPLAPFDPLREMALPYAVGRFFLRSPRDIDSILPTICVCLTLLAVWAIFEGVTGTNPLELLFGRPWANKTGEESIGGDELDSRRFGLKRAYAAQTHPIYFGLTCAMMLPWAVEAGVRGLARRGPAWWRLVPVLTLASIFCTGSRAAQICALAVLGATFYHSAPRLRPLLFLLAALAGISFLVFRDDVVKGLERYAEEGVEVDLINVNGELREYSGTRHRDLLYEVYADAYNDAGWFGYGAKYQRMPRDPFMDERFRSIDNHYLVFYLQYGYLGMIGFGALAVSVIWNLLPPAFNADGAPGRLAAGLLGAIAGCLLGMRSVWLAPDYGSVWLFCAGLTVCLSRLKLKNPTPAPFTVFDSVSPRAEPQLALNAQMIVVVVDDSGDFVPAASLVLPPTPRSY